MDIENKRQKNAYIPSISINFPVTRRFFPGWPCDPSLEKFRSPKSEREGANQNIRQSDGIMRQTFTELTFTKCKKQPRDHLSWNFKFWETFK